MVWDTDQDSFFVFGCTVVLAPLLRSLCIEFGVVVYVAQHSHTFSYPHLPCCNQQVGIDRIADLGLECAWWIGSVVSVEQLNIERISPFPGLEEEKDWLYGDKSSHSFMLLFSQCNYISALFAIILCHCLLIFLYQCSRENHQKIRRPSRNVLGIL